MVRFARMHSESLNVCNLSGCASDAKRWLKPQKAFVRPNQKVPSPLVALCDWWVGEICTQQRVARFHSYERRYNESGRFRD